jgi:hypothetical protein
MPDIRACGRQFDLYSEEKTDSSLSARPLGTHAQSELLTMEPKNPLQEEGQRKGEIMKNQAMRILAAAVVITASFAVAQETKQMPPASIGELITSRANPAVLSRPLGNPDFKPKPPSYCHPCLSYSGDFNSIDPEANALWNGEAQWEGIVGKVYVPFLVPKGVKTLRITRIVFNELMNQDPTQDLAGATFSIRTNVTAGNGGRVLKSGSCQVVTAVPTGRSGFGMSEYSMVADFDDTCGTGPIILHPPHHGPIWVTLDPIFTASSFGYLTDVPANAQNHTGWKTVEDRSFFDSPSFGVSFQNTSGVGGTCNDIGCHAFSVAISGTVR